MTQSKTHFLQTSPGRWLLFLSIAGLSACTSTDFQNGYQQGYTAMAAAAPDTIPVWQTELATATSIGNLNQLLHSPDIEGWVAQALQSNPSLQQTLLTLKIRQAERLQTRGQRLPEMTADITTTTTENDSENRNSSHTGSLTISWELDLWQRLANLDQAAQLNIRQQTLLLQSSRDTLVAEVIKSGLGLIAQQQTTAIENQRVTNLQQQADLIRQRYRLGLGTLEDLDSVETSLAAARATLESTRETLQQQRRALLTLMGRPGSQTLSLPDSMEFPEVAIALAELPVQTLARRPDLQAAYTAIEAADAERKAAYKALLPSLNLSLSLSDTDNDLRRALLTDPAWTLLSQLSAPLFKGGQLHAAADIAGLEVAQAYASYQETLLTAVNEVEDSLSLEASLSRQLQHSQTALARAESNLRQYQQKYRAGLVDILDLLTVQSQVFDLQSQVNSLTQQRLSNRVSLGLALGLSWQSDDLTSATPTNSISALSQESL